MKTSNREIIPFFNDLPTGAIRPSARLWDKARSAEYNGATAYRDFVMELTDANISTPAQAHFKRWVAGVQAGLVPRPGDEPAPVRAEPQPIEFTGIPSYFKKLPPSALGAVQSAWDRADAKGYSMSFMFDAFSRDMASVQLQVPKLVDFNVWVAGVIGGKIERPLKPVPATTAEAATPASPALASFESAPIQRQASPEGEAFELLTPQTFQEADHVPRGSSALPHGLQIGSSELVDLVAAVIERKVLALQTQAHDYARRLVAEQLRELADELEHAAA